MKRLALKSMIILVLLALAITVAYFLFLFIAHDFSPNFLLIDSCLDAGGAWNDELDQCQT